jgi:hypothetical protein
MHKQQPHPNLLARLLPASLLLCLCQGIANGAVTTTPPPIIDTEAPTNITVPGTSTFSATRPVITLDMATQVAATVTATDAASFGDPSSDIPGKPTGEIGPLAPGRHTIKWTATDVGNNSLDATQIIDVKPEVNFAVDQTVGEGNSEVKVIAYLSGKAPVYPVTINYTISGSATGGGVDHNASAGSITINDGDISGSTTPFTVTADGPGDADETIIFTITTATLPSGSVITDCSTCKNSHTITITEDNLAPIVTITATQNGATPTHAVTTGGGLVTLTADAKDPNGDIVSASAYDWSASDNALTPTSGTTSSTFTFDPTGLTPGVYTARLTVTDGSATSTRDMQLRVYTTAPTLSTTDDSDDDGEKDSTEGIKDSDGDGIPNYLDAVDNPAWLPGWDLLTYKADLKRSDSFVSGPITFAWQLDADAATITSNRVYYPLLLATQPGLKLSIGPTAFANGSHHGRMDTAAASLHFGSSLASNIVSADGQVVDIEISGLGTTGQSVYLVIPLAAPLPPNSPNFKIMSAAHSWQNFTNEGEGVNKKNTLLYVTDKSSDNYCPAPANSSYIAVTANSNALNGGISCVELLIEDGGPNDYDGQANGVIRLLGAPFITSSTASDSGATTPPEFSGDAKNSVESLNKVALTDGDGGIGFIGAWGVLGLLLAYGLRRHH